MARSRFVLPTGERISLTPRQLTALQHVASGDSNKAAAAAMSIAEKSVKELLYNVFQILGVRNRTEAVMVSMWANIVIPPLPPRAPDRLTRHERDQLRQKHAI